MEHVGSSSCLQELTTGPCSEPDKSSPYTPTVFTLIYT
jgi:hypothetical protein